MTTKPHSFRRFLLIMVFLLEGLSLTVVIGFLFAMLDRSMTQEQVQRINVQHAELRLHLTNRLNYTVNRAEELLHNNNIKIALLLGLDSKIEETVAEHYPPNMGSTFYVRSADGRFFPAPGAGHSFVKDPEMFALHSEDTVQKAVNPHTFVYLWPIVQQKQITGYVVGIYDLSVDPLCWKLLETFDDLSLVFRQDGRFAGLNVPFSWSLPASRTIEELTQEQYHKASDGNLALPLGMDEFSSLYLIVGNEQYRQRRWDMITKLVLLCIPLLVLTFTVSFLILRRVTSTLDALATNALLIAHTGGHSDLDTSQVRHAEFLSFTKAFNKVLSTVRQRTHDLKNANENLHEQIEERRQIAEALQESEAQLRSLQDNIPIGLYRRTLDGRLLFVNPKMVSIFGYDSEEEMMQLPIRRLYDDPDQFDEVMEQFEASGNIQRIELRVKRKDGTPFWVAAHFKQTVDQKTGSVYIDGAILDISDRKKIEEVKEQLEKQLQQARKMEALGTLAGGIAHDFNNILFAIIGYCELALEDAASDTDQFANLQLSIAGAKRAADLVRQILTFARQAEIKTHPLNLTPIIKESLKLMRATLPTTIEIQCELENDLTVHADPAQLHQIIVNLCTNAGHAMKETGGVLTVSVSKMDIVPGDDAIELGLIHDCYAMLRVVDTGHGMSEEILERIFDPYYTTKPQGEGTGMGLSVVQGIVRSLNGAITVDSIPGKGTAFSIYLPVLDEVDSEQNPHGEPVAGGKEHILFVDDERALTLMVQKTLTKIGYRVTTKNNPVEALDLFRQGPDEFDMVISDVTMPMMDGLEMVGEMTKIRPHLPVMLCTGYSEKIDAGKTTDIGDSTLLYKPLSRHELSSAIRRILDSQIKN